MLSLQLLSGNVQVKIYSTKGQLITDDIRTDSLGDATWEVSLSISWRGLDVIQ